MAVLFDKAVKDRALLEKELVPGGKLWGSTASPSFLFSLPTFSVQMNWCDIGLYTVPSHREDLELLWSWSHNGPFLIQVAFISVPDQSIRKGTNTGVNEEKYNSKIIEIALKLKIKKFLLEEKKLWLWCYESNLIQGQGSRLNTPDV